MLTIVSFDGRFDLPQHLFTSLADSRAQRPDRCRRAEGKDIREVLGGKVPLRLHPAAGHESIRDADRCGVLEGDLRAVFIIRFQDRSRKDVEDIPAVFRPILPGQLIGCRFQLTC